MEILQLRYFCDAAITQNFSHTAQKFKVPPSDISQSIKRLEKELGTQLFCRHANKIILNEKGIAFSREVTHALKILDDARSNLSHPVTGTKLKICITTNRRVVMSVTEKYRKLHSDTVFVIRHNLPEPDEDYNLIIADGDFGKDENYVGKLIVSEEIVLAVNKNHPLAAKGEGSISAKDLEKEGFVTMFSGSSLHKTLVKVAKDMGFTPNIVIQSDDPFYIRKCVELGLGIAFVPSVSWQGQFSEDIVLKKAGGYIRNTFAYYNRLRPMSDATEEFLSMLSKECEMHNDVI